MVTVAYDQRLEKAVRNIKDKEVKERVKRHIRKIVNNPHVGKPMRFARKGTREIYVPPFRLSSVYLQEKDTIVFLDFYHKDKQ
ncbi:MAG: hypothetical protein PHU95_05875 [Candidatus Thermoplasmatota archaeon]|nr:hypothetical protein [Candidatus Thermoplasmatota archaeon]MDD5778956.1 hypothetical protein [Candidatus Thermoplasmatota archaeon]